jgi:hypothetical protein
MDRILEVTGRGIRLGKSVFLYGRFIVVVPLGVAYSLADGLLCRALIGKSNSLYKLVYKAVKFIY